MREPVTRIKQIVFPHLFYLLLIRGAGKHNNFIVMGLLNMLFSSHQQTARDLFDNFLNEEHSYRAMAKQYNNKFALANYYEFVAHLNKIHDMFCTELRLIKEPITFRGYDFCYTPAQAVKHMEDFIMEIMKQNLKK